jgi:hypothetical protein
VLDDSREPADVHLRRRFHLDTVCAQPPATKANPSDVFRTRGMRSSTAESAGMGSTSSTLKAIAMAVVTRLAPGCVRHCPGAGRAGPRPSGACARRRRCPTQVCAWRCQRSGPSWTIPCWSAVASIASPWVTAGPAPPGPHRSCRGPVPADEVCGHGPTHRSQGGTARTRRAARRRPHRRSP